MAKFIGKYYSSTFRETWIALIQNYNNIAMVITSEGQKVGLDIKNRKTE